MNPERYFRLLFTLQEAKAFDERIHHVAREDRMSESTKDKIMGTVFVISFALFTALIASVPVLLVPILIGGAVVASILMSGLEKAYEKF